MTQKLDMHILKNGMVILAEPMESVASVAFGFMIPAGAARLEEGLCGAANVISDWIFRGAGDKNSLDLSNALDNLGLHRASFVSSSHINVGAVTESENLHKALDLYADIICLPTLDDKQFELVRQSELESIRGLDDDPRTKVMLKLRQQFYPYPLGRSRVGEIEELKSLTADQARRAVKQHFDFSQMIFSVAGKYDFDALVAQAESLFADKQSQPQPLVTIGQPGPKYTHIHNDSAQVHIGLMTETVTPDHEDYYNAQVAVSVLSGGMSARLFTEVREKRGLCYSIGASYHTLKQTAGINCYAGTTPQKAQETLDVILAEFDKLKQGITQEEIDRAKVGLKSSLIMSSESSANRASGIGGDWYILGRVRPLEEIKEMVEKTTIESVLDFLNRKQFGDFTIVTVGPKQVEIK